MLRKVYPIVGWFFLIALQFMSSASANNLPIIGVTEITAPVEGGSYWRQANTKAANFQVMLETQLIQIGRFKVIERNRLDQVLQEQGINNSLGDGLTAGGGYHVDGVDYLVYGAITKFGQSRQGIETGGFSSQQIITEFAADIKVVDASTGEIRRAETAEVVMKTSEGMSTGSFTNRSGSADALSDIQRTAARQVASIIATSIFPIEVLRGGETVYLNYGKAILEEGDVLQVYMLGEALIDEATGLNLGSEETPVAKIKVTEVADMFSKARILSGESPSKGNIARIVHQADSAKKAPSRPEKRGKKI